MTITRLYEVVDQLRAFGTKCTLGIPAVSGASGVISPPDVDIASAFDPNPEPYNPDGLQLPRTSGVSNDAVAASVPTGVVRVMA